MRQGEPRYIIRAGKLADTLMVQRLDHKHMSHDQVQGALEGYCMQPHDPCAHGPQASGVNVWVIYLMGSRSGLFTRVDDRDLAHTEFNV